MTSKGKEEFFAAESYHYTSVLPSPEDPLGGYWSAQIPIALILSPFFQWGGQFGPGSMVYFSPLVKRGKMKVTCWNSSLVLCHVSNTGFLSLPCPASLMSGFPMIVELPCDSLVGWHLRDAWSTWVPEQIHVLCASEHKSSTAFISTTSLHSSEHGSPDCHCVGATFVWAVQSFALAGCFADLPELHNHFSPKAVHQLCTQNMWGLQVL